MLFVIQFWSNLFWMVQNDPNFVPNIFLCQKSQILGVFFSFVCETLWRAGRRTMKFTPCMLHVMYRKNLKNTKILRAALHCEIYIWNMKIFVTCHLIVVEIFGDFGTEFLMTIQIVPNSFQINCSQNVRETAKISGAISFPYLESQLDPKYLNESETDKMLFSNIFYLKQFISKKMRAEVQNP